MAITEDIFKSFFENLFRALGSAFPRGVKAVDALKGSAEIRRIAKDIVDDPKLAVDCFFIQMAHNGGRPIMPHNFKYRSIVGGYFDPVILPEFDPDRYKYLELDYEYELLLINIVERRNWYFTPDELSGSKLNVKLRSEGLKFVRYYCLKNTRRGIWYIMIGTTHPEEKLNDDRHSHTFNLAAGRIKQIIKKY